MADDQGTPTLETPEIRADRRRRFAEASVTVDDLVNNAKAPEWCVQGLLPASGVIVVAGLAKHARKTYTMLHLLHCFASGKPFLGKFSVRQGVGYMANLEDGADRLGWRARTMGMGNGEPILFLRDRDALSLFMEVMNDTETRFDLAVVDPLAECALLRGLKNENDPLEMIAAVVPFRAAALKCKRCFVLVHHFRKAGDMARGSSALQGAVDGWWDIYPVAGEPNLTHVEVTLRDGPPVEFGVRTTFNGDGTVTHEYVDPDETRNRKEEPKAASGRGRAKLADADLREEILTALREDGVVLRLPKTELRKKVGHQTGRVNNLIEAMAADGSLWFDSGTRTYTISQPGQVPPMADLFKRVEQGE